MFGFKRGRHLVLAAATALTALVGVAPPSSPVQAAGPCVSSQVFTAGVDDNFSTANGPELPVPSTDLKAFRGQTSVSTRAFDATGSDSWFQHTFTGLAAPVGETICNVTVTMRVQNGDLNDAVILEQVSGGVQISDGSYNDYLTTIGVPLGDSGVATLDLATLPQGLSDNFIDDPIGAVIANGFLDVTVQDDSAVDFVTLELFTSTVYDGVVTVDKMVNGEDETVVGAEYPTTFTYLVTNNTEFDVTPVSLVDDPEGPIELESCEGYADPLAPGDSFTCVLTTTAGYEYYCNTATFTGTIEGVEGIDGEVVIDGDDTACYTPQFPEIVDGELNISKTTNGQANAGNITVGTPITWTYVVTNNTNVPLSDIQVADSREGTVPSSACTDPTPVLANAPTTTLYPDQSITCTLTGTAALGSYSNRAIAAGTNGLIGEIQSAEVTSSYTGIAAPRCVSTIKQTVGTVDNFVGPEPASPSTQLLALYNPLINGRRGFDDPGNDRHFLHTLTGLVAPNGRRICKALLQVAVKNNGPNDAMALFSLASTETAIGTLYNTFLPHENVPLGTSGVMSFDLGNLAGDDATDASTLLPEIRAKGLLDVMVQDDSAVDWIMIEIFTEPDRVRPVTGVVPGRLLETRQTPGAATADGKSLGAGPTTAGQVTTVQVAGRGNVPAGATAAVLNLTAVRAQARGFATLYPCTTEVPNASTLNYSAGINRANATVVQLSATGKICIFTSSPTHLLLDVAGFVTSTSDVWPILPARYIETRSGPDIRTFDGASQGAGKVGAGSVTRVRVAGRGEVEAGAGSALVNVTAVAPDARGFLTLYPCTEDVPNASTLNFEPGAPVANSTIVQLSESGDVCIFSSVSTHLILDVSGFLPAESDLGTVVPARLLETRQGPNAATIDGLSLGAGQTTAGQIVRVQVTGRGQVPVGATLAMVNVTSVGSATSGFATLYPCTASVPTASTLNYGPGAPVANATMVPLNSRGEVCILTSAPTHLLLDVAGFVEG